MGRVQSRGEAPAGLDLGALCRAVWGESDLDSGAAWLELGRRAARDGGARRFLLDVAEGRLSLPPESATPAFRELARRDSALVVSLLQEAGACARPVLAAALGQSRHRFLDRLLALARDDDVADRLAAVAGLAEAAARGAPEAVDALGDLLRDPRGEVRWAAAVALGRARGRAAGGARLLLQQIPRLEDARLLAAGALSAVALWKSRPARAARLLLELAESGPAGRKAAAVAVRGLSRRTGAGVLNLCVRDPDPQVRALCAGALADWAGQGSAPAERQLRGLAGDASPDARAAVAAAAAGCPESARRDLLSRLSRDRAPAVRAAAAAGLGRSRLDEAPEILLRLAGDRAPAVRAAAVAGLAELGYQSLLRRACRDPAPSVRAAAVSALQPRGSSDGDLLVSLSRSSRAEVARAAATTLCRHICDLGAPAWARAGELIADDATAAPAALGLAAALDRDLEAPGRLLMSWPLGDLSSSFLWAVARAARTARAAELARTAARAMAGGDQMADKLRDLSAALHGIGARSLAAQVGWVAECAGASALEEVASLAAAAPRADGAPKEIPSLAAAARSVRRALDSRSDQIRDRHLVRARAALEAALPADRRHLSFPWVEPVLQAWSAMLDEPPAAPAPAELRASVASRHLVAGARGSLLIEVENAGGAPARQVRVRVAGAGSPPPLAALAPGASAQMPIVIECAHPGTLAVRGTVEFLDAAARRRVPLGGTVEVLEPPTLGAVANPYVVGKPLAPESAMFFGRAAEIAYLQRALSAGEGASVVVLVGARRVGKTSLLRRLESRLAGRCRAVFVDVQGMLLSGTEALFRELARRSLPEGEMLLSDGEAPGTRGADMVREAAARLGRPVVLLLDEFDDLEQKVRAGLLGQEVFGQLRHLIQHSGSVSLVLCGTHRIEELAGEHWSFLLNLATYQRVGFLDPEAAEEVIRVPLARLGIACDDAAVQRALRLAGRHPYLLQLLGYRLVEICVASQQAAARLDTVEKAADRVIEQGDIHLRYLWESAGPQGQLVVRALAREASGLAPGELTKTTGLAPAALARVVRSLTESELVEKRAGRCALQIGLLSRWLTRR